MKWNTHFGEVERSSERSDVERSVPPIRHLRFYPCPRRDSRVFEEYNGPDCRLARATPGRRPGEGFRELRFAETTRSSSSEQPNRHRLARSAGLLFVGASFSGRETSGPPAGGTGPGTRQPAAAPGSAPAAPRSPTPPALSRAVT